jgi:hypothetical protein
LISRFASDAFNTSIGLLHPICKGTAQNRFPPEAAPDDGDFDRLKRISGTGTLRTSRRLS